MVKCYYKIANQIRHLSYYTRWFCQGLFRLTEGCELLGDLEILKNIKIILYIGHAERLQPLANGPSRSKPLVSNYPLAVLIGKMAQM